MPVLRLILRIFGILVLILVAAALHEGRDRLARRRIFLRTRRVAHVEGDRITDPEALSVDLKWERVT
jgi:hypothetical protein